MTKQENTFFLAILGEKNNFNIFFLGQLAKFSQGKKKKKTSNDHEQETFSLVVVVVGNNLDRGKLTTVVNGLWWLVMGREYNERVFFFSLFIHPSIHPFCMVV
jgi:hypothetical protein